MALWLRALIYMALIGGGWLVLLPAGLLYLEQDQILPVLRPWPPIVLGAALILAGAVLALHAGYYLIVYGRGTPFPLDPTHVLVADGPYSRVRNPQSIAMMLMVLGEVLLVRSNLLWLMIPLSLAYLECLVGPLEHRWMRRQFGEEYQRYVLEVPRWVPCRRGLLRNRQAWKGGLR